MLVLILILLLPTTEQNCSHFATAHPSSSYGPLGLANSGSKGNSECFCCRACVSHFGESKIYLICEMQVQHVCCFGFPAHCSWTQTAGNKEHRFVVLHMSNGSIKSGREGRGEKVVERAKSFIGIAIIRSIITEINFSGL